jgi:hypothetical protein
MLKTIIYITLLLSSFDAFSCWNAKGSFSTDGETWEFNQRFEHNKEYILPFRDFLLHLTLVAKNKKPHFLHYEIKQKKGLKISLVSKGLEEDIQLDQPRDIYAKGETGQPNSIITIKLSNN